MKKKIQVTINGSAHVLDDFRTASYEWLCETAGFDPKSLPTVTFDVPIIGGKHCGTLTRGMFAPMCHGAHYDVSITNAA